MVSSVDALLAVGILAGGALYWSGFRAYRMSDRLGRRAFVAFAAVLGTGCIAAGIVGLVLSPFSSTEQEAMWAQIPFVFWIATMLPWFVFAVQYTGTRTRMRPRTVALLGLPLVLPVVDLTLSILTASDTFLNYLGSVVALYTFALGVAGAFLLLRKSYSYDHIPIGQGVSLSIAPLGSLVLWNLIGQMDSAPGKAGAYAAGAALAAVGVGAALSRYGLFKSTPSIGTLGERGLTRETDDLMFVIDDDRVITVNETAVELLDHPHSSLPGTALRDILDHDSEQLREIGTVQIQTTRGTRQYDPQVSRVRDHLGNDIGATISLRDVTERELREQRLAVLNRVLRHNLRNQADVVRGHAESLEAADEQVDTIIDAADAIAALGQQARRIDGYVSGSGDQDTVHLASVVGSVVESVDVDDHDVTVSVDVPASATITTNRRAMVGALESAIDNAVQYTDSTVRITAETESAGYTIRIADDGPGIPEWELDSLDTGTESPLEHSTGLGLWQLKWAVKTLNGDLSFNTTDGTVVEIFVPCRTDESLSP